MSKHAEAPRWFWLVLGGGTLVYVFSAVGPLIYCYYNGKETVAEVTRVSRETEGGGLANDLPRDVNYYTLSYDGHSAKRRTSGKHRVGERLPVIYLPENPSRLVRGKRADGLWNAITLSCNETKMIVYTGLGVFFLLCTLKKPNR